MKSVDQGKFLTAALMRMHTPYIWGAKGRVLWASMPPYPKTQDVIGCPVALDCSGLVTCSMRDAGGDDLTLTHNAALLCAELAPVVEGEANIYLAFFSPALTKVGVMEPQHVAIAIRVGTGLHLLEAAGGDSTCTTLAKAQTRNAEVRVSRWDPTRRGAFATRALP